MPDNLGDEEQVEAPKYGLAEYLPIIRMLSRKTTLHLARLGLTPNHVTTLGLLAGLAAAGFFTQQGFFWQTAGATLFALAYLFDYCDGELARLLQLTSKFGAHYDDFVDGVIHAAFFLALGYGHMAATGEAIWLWLGAAAALGGTINAILPLFLGGVPEGETQVATLSDLEADAGWIDVLIFAFRGLARADFWLLVLILSLFGWTWVLLPAAAIGAQVYWMIYLKRSARRILT